MPWQSPGKKHKEGTSLAELHIGHMRDAHDIIGIQPEDFTPVVLVPDMAVSRICGAPCPWVSVPSGFSALVTRFGKEIEGDNEEDGSWSPGFHCFAPWNEISKLVSRQFMVFDTPVRDCKTKDNITVNIDVLIVFKIENARTFVYGIGPEKLDDLLRASQEEVLRQMAGETDVMDIYDLFGSAKTKPYVDIMNKDFQEHGVKVLNFTVRNVRIPGNMARDFEDKTLYESKTMEANMQQESDRLDLDNQEECLKLKETTDNMRMAAEAEAVTALARITKEVREVVAETDGKITFVSAERVAQVTDIETTSALEVAKIDAEKSLMENDQKVRMKAEVDKLDASVEAYEQNKWSEGQQQAAERIAEGKKAMAMAEGEAAEAFAARRSVEQEWARINILDKIANNRNIQMVTSLENNTGLAPGNSLVAQITHQGMEAMRMKLGEMTAGSAGKLDMGKVMAGGLIRPTPQQQKMKD